MADAAPGPVTGDEYSTDESESCDLCDTDGDDEAELSADLPPPSPAVAGSGQTDAVPQAVFSARDRYLMTKLIGRTLRRFSSDVMIQSSAVAATLEAAEAYLTGLMQSTNTVAQGAARDKITRMDMRLAMRIRGEDRGGAPSSTPQAPVPGFAFGAAAPAAPTVVYSAPITLYGFGNSAASPSVPTSAPVAAPPPATADPTQTQAQHVRSSCQSLAAHISLRTRTVIHSSFT